MKLRRSPLIIDTVRGKDCGCWRSDAAFPRGCRAVGVKRGSPGLRRVRRWGRKASGGREGAPRWRNDGGDFYFQNHAQVSISEVLFPGSRPRGLPAAPAGAGGDFYFQNHAQVSISEVPGPGSCPRGLPAAPPAPPACHFDCKTQHFGDAGRHFPDSVENSDIY